MSTGPNRRENLVATSSSVSTRIGKDAPAIADALDGVCRIETVASKEAAAGMDAAVEAAHRIAAAGDTVLLSPACASFDMFRDYGHRGDVFAAAVQRLKGSSPKGSSP